MSRYRDGFTLVELLAVIAIIGILAVTAIAGYNGMTERSKQKAYEAKVQLIETAAAKWAKENNIDSKVQISVNKLVVQGYLQADTVSDEGKAVVANPKDNTNMICKVVNLSMNEGTYEAKFVYSKDNCSLAYQATYDSQINIIAVDTSNRVLNFNDNTVEWTSRDISLVVSSEEFYGRTVSISYDFNGETITKEVSGNKEYKPESAGKYQYQINVDEYYNVFNVSADVILNAPVVVTYLLTDGNIYSRIINVRIDKEKPTFIAEAANEWDTNNKVITISVDDGEGSGPKGVYVSNDKSNMGEIKLTDYKIDVPVEGIGTYYIWVEDNVGNISRDNNNSIIINNVDSTEPSCIVSFEGTSGDNGWYVDDVTVVATTNTAGPSGFNYGISKNNTPVYSEFVSEGNIGRIEMTKKQGQTGVDGQKYYCYVKSLSGTVVRGENTVKIDKTGPSVIVEPESNDENSNVKIVNLSIYDGLSGLRADNVIYYAWSEDKNNVPTEWLEAPIVSVDGSKERGEVKIMGTQKVGVYYLWIKEDSIKDIAGNPNGIGSTAYGPYVFSPLIKYDGNGASGGFMKDVLCPYNEKCNILDNKYIYNGKEFEGWYTAPSGGTKYGTTSKFIENTTLYAHWKNLTYNIKYNLNNGSYIKNGSYPTIAEIDKEILINNPYRTFTLEFDMNNTGITKPENISTTYTFEGWTATNLSTFVAKYGSSNNVITSWSDGNTKVKDIYFLNLNSNNGTVKLKANWASPSALKLPSLVKDGYTCNWNTKSNGKGESYEAGKEYSLNTNSNGNLTLYAYCTKVTYEIKYAGGGTVTSPTSAQYGSEVTIKNSNNSKVSLSFKKNNIDADFSSTTKVEKTIEFNGWSSSNELGLNVSTAKYGKSSATSKWSGDSTKYTKFKNLRSTSGPVTMLANWKEVIFKLPTIDKAGRICFWNTDSKGNGKDYKSGDTYKTSTPGNITLYARCETITYKIKYEVASGKTDSKSPLSAKFGKQIYIYKPTGGKIKVKFDLNNTGASASSLEDQEAEYKFKGWSSKDVDDTAKYTKKNNTWNGKVTTASYFKNLKSTASEVSMIANWEASIVLPEITKDNVSCTWNLTSDGSGTSYKSKDTFKETSGVSKTITLYADCRSCSRENPTLCPVYYPCRSGKTKLYTTGFWSKPYFAGYMAIVYEQKPLYKLSSTGNWYYMYSLEKGRDNKYFSENYGYVHKNCLTTDINKTCAAISCPDYNG